jgi:RimK family alpha-L-glutamate ligase
MAKILWLDWEVPYVTQRIKEAAAGLGLELAAREINEFVFSVDGRNGKAGVLEGEHDLREMYDILIMRTFFPRISEGLTIARLFAEAGKVVIDRSLTNQGYVISKMHDYLLLAEQGLHVPTSFQLCDLAEVERVAESLGYPCVLKAVHGAYGNHVHLVQNADELRRKLWRYPVGDLMLQEYLPAAEDFRIITIGYKALPKFVSRKPRSGDFRTNFELGGHSQSHELSEYPELCELAEHAARTLQREFAGVDIRFKGNQPVLLEVNRRPAFQNFEQTTGLDVAGAFLTYAHNTWLSRYLSPNPNP